MDPKQIIEQLKLLGLSEYEIAKRLSSSDEPVSQSTINRIATGDTANPSYRVWKALSDLLAELNPSSSRELSMRASA
jgi:transcriptional regulator with XRE-family HTH domain